MNNNQQQGLNNLKSIYQIQMGGSIQKILRDIRSSKTLADDFSHEVMDKKKLFELQEQLNQKEEEKFETSVNDAKSSVQEAFENEFKAEEIVEQEKSLEKKEVVAQKTVVRQEQKNTNRPYDNYRKDNRQFDNNRQFENKRPFDPNRKPYDQNRKPYDPNRKPFDPNKRVFDKNKSFNKDFKKPGSNPQRNSSFIASKGNSVKVFAPALESSSVLAQPERNYGNKNKSQRNLDEKNKQHTKQKGVTKRNILIEDVDGFEETTMGSRKLIKTKKKEESFVAPKIENAIITTENVSVKLLSEKTGRPVSEIIKKLMMLGVMATINSTIDFATAELICEELGVKLEQKLDKTAEDELLGSYVAEKDEEEHLVKRPPVVTVMGHVDHGKTSLLDIIRKTNVVSGEAGGITQKIGAYTITSNGNKITFIDTPGHAAFTSMRARGAKITDVAILVVAADDGIMPQTIEAINHIKAANVPMIVAINKMDKPEANPERIKQQLSENGVLPEEWGGDTILVPVSAKTGVGIDNLLNMILLVSDMQELKANPNRLALAVVLEAELDKNRGPVATVLIQNGTLKVGDNIISGVTFGKVRAMYDENGNNVKQATPSTPVSVLGFDEVPQSGDQVYVVNEKLSKQVIEERKWKIKQERANLTSGVSLDDFMDRVNEGKLKNLNIIIKADVQGSVEALKQSLTAIENEEVRVVCVHSGAGAVTESDLVLAQASNSIIISFNLKVPNKISQMSENLGVEIKEYKVIYDVVDEITRAIKGMMTVKYEKQTIGHAEIRVVFKLSSQGTIAGSYVTDGKVMRNCGVKVIRGEEELIDTTVEALKIQKDDKAEVNRGYECGIKLKDFSAIKEGDILEFYQNVEIAR